MRCNPHCVSGSALILRQQFVLQRCRGAGFHLMMKAISRASVLACHAYFPGPSASKEQKPPSARTNKGVGFDSLCCHRKAALKVVITPDADCCTPWRKANSSKYPNARSPQKASKPSYASVGTPPPPPLFLLVPTVFVHSKGIEIDWGVATSPGCKINGLPLIVLESNPWFN